MESLLKNKAKTLNSNVHVSMKEHINECNACWNMWNRVRWDSAMKTKGFNDIKEYFGKCYIQYFDSSWALANEWYSQNPKTEKQVSDFYKMTSYYIYNSFIFNKSGDRISKIKPLIPILKKYNLNSVLDYGCGIGLDGLEMLDHELEVHFVDFISPSTDFLKWQLAKYKKMNNRYFIHDIETIKKNPPSVDLIWTVDVLEHMLNPMRIFQTFTKQTKAFIYYIDSAGKDGGRHPFHFDVDYKKVEERLKKLGFSKVEHSIFQIWIKKNKK